MHSPLLLCCLLSMALTNAAEVPLGHPDFYPTPERPIGWRGDGNGSFPGATLVDRFGDGPMATIDAPGGTNGTGKKMKTVITLEKPAPLNVVWKVPLPGFTQSQPIIVGHQVILTCEPTWMLCLDIHSGEELWRFDMDPLLLAGRSPAEAERASQLLGIIRTMHSIKANLGGNYSRFGKITAENLAIWRERAVLIQTLAKQAQTLGGSAEAVGAAEALVATLASMQPEPGKDDKETAKAFAKIYEGLAKGYYETYKIHATSHWYGWIGDSWPTPVCDGTHLYTFTSHGTVVCLDLEGQLVWRQQFTPPKGASKMPRAISPLLIDDVLFVPFFESFALDKRNGKVLWEGGASVVSGGNVCLNPIVVALPDGHKAIASCGKEEVKVFDAATGKLLKKVAVPKGAHDPGPGVLVHGDVLYSPYNGWAGRMTGSRDSLQIQELWTGKNNGCGSHILDGKRIFFGEYALDLETGKELAKSQGQRISFTGSNRPSLGVGDRILAVQNDGWGDYGCAGPERMKYHTSMAFAVLGADGTLISQDNLLTSELPTAAPWVPEAARPLLEQGHLYDMNGGVPTNFGFGPAFAQGNRVVIPGLSHLWCIGDPTQRFNGTAGPKR